jgi:hypothetical protein
VTGMAYLQNARIYEWFGTDPMAMRPCGKEFQVVGAAYVGNKSRRELEESSDPWDTICIL